VPNYTTDNIPGTFQIQDLRKQGNRVEATVQHGNRTHQVFFESDDIDLAPAREALVALSLYPCMKTGSDLEVNGGISARVLQSISHIMDVYHCWYPLFQHINLCNVQAVPTEIGKAKRVALFFSGGLDCWYSLLKHQSEITDLVYIWGWEVHHEDRSLFEKDLNFLRRISESYSKHLVVIRTNLREFTETYIPWHWMYGTVMAAVAQMVSGEISKVYISSGDWYSSIMPAGSHVLVDPHWSTENLEIIHDSLEVTRLGKALLVGQDPLALQTLRVCWEHPGGVLNCGRCEKCLRTMVNLQVVGALDRCTTFALPLDLKRLSKMTFFYPSALAYVEENVRSLQQQPHNRRLYQVLRWALVRFYFFDYLRKRYPLIHSMLLRLKNTIRGIRPRRVYHDH
jgi:hypothetical protein